MEWDTIHSNKVPKKRKIKFRETVSAKFRKNIQIAQLLLSKKVNGVKVHKNAVDNICKS